MPECEQYKLCGWFDWLFLFFFCKMLENRRQERAWTCFLLLPVEQLLVFMFVRIPGHLTQASNIFLHHKYPSLGLLHCMSANGDGLTTATTKKGFRCRLLWCLVVSKSQGLGMQRPAVAPIHSHNKRVRMPSLVLRPIYTHLLQSALSETSFCVPLNPHNVFCAADYNSPGGEFLNPQSKAAVWNLNVIMSNGYRTNKDVYYCRSFVAWVLFYPVYSLNCRNMNVLHGGGGVWTSSKL